MSFTLLLFPWPPFFPVQLFAFHLHLHASPLFHSTLSLQFSVSHSYSSILCISLPQNYLPLPPPKSIHDHPPTPCRRLANHRPCLTQYSPIHPHLNPTHQSKLNHHVPYLNVVTIFKVCYSFSRCSSTYRG